MTLALNGTRDPIVIDASHDGNTWYMNSLAVVMREQEGGTTTVSVHMAQGGKPVYNALYTTEVPTRKLENNRVDELVAFNTSFDSVHVYDDGTYKIYDEKDGSLVTLGDVQTGRTPTRTAPTPSNTTETWRHDWQGHQNHGGEDVWHRSGGSEPKSGGTSDPQPAGNPLFLGEDIWPNDDDPDGGGQ